MSPQNSPTIATDASRPLKVLHVIPGMATEIGGPPAVCAGLTAALAARGHAVTVATLDEGNLPTVPLTSNVELRRFSPDGPAPGRYAKSAALDGWLRAHVAGFDIAHLHSIWQFPTFAAARACWAHKVPYVVLLNGMLDTYCVNERSRHLKRAYWMWREGRIEGRAAAIHCLNQAEIRRAVPWIRGLPKFIAGNGIDADTLRSLPEPGGFRAAHPELAEKPLVLFLSRLHPKKGLDRLIPAWKVVAEKRRDVRFLIAGTGDASYVEMLKAMVRDAGQGEHILFLGQVVGRAKWELLIDCNVFVLPSHQEGFSMAITEALAAGCTPVVTEECNFDELEPVSPGVPCGMIIRDGNMTQMCEGVLDLLSNPAKKDALGAAGKQLVAARFTWQTIAAALEQNYRHILAGEHFSPQGAALR